MKRHNRIFIGTMLTLASTIGMGSCTDQIAFGDAFLEKAPGGDATEDTVFNDAEYTRQFLASMYNMQYYGLPYRSSNNNPQTVSYWNGKAEALSDIYQLHFPNSMLYKSYYSGSYTASTGTGVYSYLRENVWELVRGAYKIIERVDGVPGLEQTEKNRMKAEAKCLIASGYFNMFRFYGGLPIIKGTFTGTESNYELPRASVENTVKFMVGLLDEAVATSGFPWAYEGAEAQSETGRWTRAGAMALKCKILQFAASPLFNDTKPYYDGTTDAEKDSLVWYGGYKAELWQQAKEACAKFISELQTNGRYQLVQPTAQTQEAYRYAYRTGYVLEGSPEVLHSVRVTTSTHDSKYQWFLLRTNERLAYTPTQEYINMFPWADGKPFDWDEVQATGRLSQMFVKGDTVVGKQDLQNRVYTRDPRLYETACVNGALAGADWSSGKTSGNIYECWVGGSDAGTGPQNETGVYATGYRNNKYIIGDVYDRKYPQWVTLRLSDLYLTYAEALLQADNNFAEAIKYVDMVRARVGLKGLVECNPTKNLTTNKEALLEEIMRERACELGFEDSRYFDLIRYKRSDIFEKTLHGVRIYRLKKDASGKWTRSTDKWWNGDKKTDKGDKNKPGFYEPSYFEFEVFPIVNRARVWWEGFDAKWYLQPFPQTEVNKGYGLVQNPGW